MIRRHEFAILLAIFIWVGAPASVWAGDIRSICWITEAWPKFTQEDGKGIYHDLIRAIFATQNVQVEVTYAPWKRAVEMVKIGRCDMTGGIETSAKYHQSKYPIYEYRRVIVFQKGAFTWNGLESLLGKRGVWVRGLDSQTKCNSSMTVNCNGNRL
jgi:hypothetical protein